MNKIELYDILTLSDNKEYTVIKILDYKEKIYYLLSQIDKEENIIPDNIRILEYDNKETLTEIEDENLLKEITEKFISLMDEDN